MSNYDVSRLIRFHDPFMNDDEAAAKRLDAAARDRDEQVVDCILDHVGSPKHKSMMDFLVRWAGFSEDEDSWLPWKEVKDLAALDVYIALHPELFALK